MNPVNPVSSYYSSYKFPTLPTIICKDYIEVLSKAKASKTSATFVNSTKQTLTDKALTIDMTFSTDLVIICVMNFDMNGKSSLVLKGSNYSLSNISLLNGSTSFTAPSYVVDVSASNLTMINFSMVNFKVKDSDKDYIRVATSAKSFKMYNSLLDGKSNIGVFLRFDFPDHAYVKNSVFKNFTKISSDNGGEMIRLATSDYETKDAFATIDSCYFTNCVGDPEIVSVKCSSNTIKGCVFEKNSSSKLVFRHAHRCTSQHNYFDGSGMRIYGTDHKILDNQLNNSANILLDNKSGGSYVPAKNCVVDYLYYLDGTPVTNSTNTNTNKITNVIKQLKYNRSTFFSATPVDPVDPVDPIDPIDPVDPVDPIDPIDPIDPVEILIPGVVDVNRVYKLNTNLTDVQVQQILDQFMLKK